MGKSENMFWHCKLLYVTESMKNAVFIVPKL